MNDKKAEIEPAVVAPNSLTGEEQIKFETGAVRSSTVAGESPGAYPARFDLLLPTVLLRDAQTLGEGAKKYGSRNYWKGMTESSLLNHALAHIFQWMTGDRSEDHLAHARWNLAVIMHEETTRPEFLDLQAAIKETGFYIPAAERQKNSQ